MKNIIHRTVAALVSQARTAATALAAKAEALGLVHVVAVAFLAKITDLVTAREVYDRAKTDWEAERNALKAMVATATTFARTAREVLKPYFGESFNAVLAGAGFNGSFAIPARRELLVELLQKLASYMKANPTHENAVLNITAARATQLASDLEGLIATVAEKKAAARSKKLDRDVKLNAVRADLQTLLSELRVVLDPISPDWDQFGFKPPGILATPDVPQNVIAVLVGPTAVAVKWDQAARATTYRLWKKVVGVDQDFVLVGSRTDLDFTIEGLPSGATIEIAVSASNNGGESAKSEIVSVVTAA